MRSEEVGNKQKQDDEKENCDILANPISSQGFVDRCGWSKKKDKWKGIRKAQVEKCF